MENPTIANKQKTCIVKSWMGQYMDHAWKQLFVDRGVYPSKTCHVCNSPNIDTWLHVPLKCKTTTYASINNQKSHYKIVWELQKKTSYLTQYQDTTHSWMLKLIMHYMKKTRYQYDYYRAHVMPKDIIAMLVLNTTYYVS